MNAFDEIKCWLVFENHIITVIKWAIIQTLLLKKCTKERKSGREREREKLVIKNEASFSPICVGTKSKEGGDIINWKGGLTYPLEELK